MSLPRPRKNENEADFTRRFMKSQSARKQYQNKDDRLLIANELWDEANPIIVHNQFGTLTANFENLVREDTLEGRECWVVNMVMLTEGVHAGSNGSIYYSPEEIKKSVTAWDGKAVVVYHPEMNGQPITANNKAIWDTRKVGVIMNTNFADGKLRAEAWVYKDAAARIDGRVVDSIVLNQMMELSTGLFGDYEDSIGTWNGEPYSKLVRNFRPDHLALLPDKVGACSTADGAGFIRNEESFSEIERELQSLLNPDGHADAPNAVGGGDNYKYIHDTFPEYVVYAQGEEMYRQGYGRDGESNLELVGEPIKVEKIVEYIPVVNSKGEEVKREEQVAELIANSKFEESDREFLMALEDEVFGKVSASALTANEDNADTIDEDKDTDTGGSATDTTDNGDGEDSSDGEGEGDTNTAPVTNAKDEDPEYAKRVEMGLALLEAKQTGLVEQITANARNTFSKDDLMGKGIGELEAIAKLAEVHPSFEGQGQSPAPTTNEHVETPL